MGVFSKLKDVLFDVEEDEIPVITRDEKPVENEEDNPIKEVKMPREDFFDEVEPVKEEIEEIPSIKKEFNFPMDDFEEDYSSRSKRDFFDEDFTSRSNSRAVRKDNYEYDYSRLDIKNTKKDEVKNFTPSPVISPVYGILDQNYTKDDVIVKNDGSKRRNEKAPNLDEVRKKAYGKKKETIEEIEEESLKTLDEILIDTEKDDVIPKPKVREEKPIINEPLLDDSATSLVFDDELPDEPYADENRVSNNNIDIKEETLESDLFNLIDSMYEEKNEREEE